jgi:threonine synthase
LPQHTIVPTAGGTILPKIYKAYQELVKLGLVEDTKPKIYSAQAAGCNPVVTAIQKGSDIIEPQKPNTIAKSIAIGNPADGYYAYRAAKDSGGYGEHATDEEIIEGMRLLARTEGIFAETAGGVTVATAKKLIENGTLDPDAETVLLITGDGLKTLDAVQDKVGPQATVPPSTAAVRAALDR